MSCRACGAPVEALARFAPSVTSASRQAAFASALGLCPRCGLLQTDAAVDWADYYARAYDARLTDDGDDELVSTTTGELVFRTDLDYAQLRRLLPDLHPGLALFELGCGRARILSRLHRDGFRDLAAHDLAERYRDGAARFCGARVHIGARPDLRCDLAYALFVLEHDDAPAATLRYLHGVVRPGGRLYLVVPNHLTNVIDLACADHLSHFSPATLAALVEACGFAVEAVDDGTLGAVALVARRRDAVVAADAAPAAAGEAVAASRGAAAGFLAYLAALRRTIAALPVGEPVWLYGAGFYATLVHAELAAAGRGVAGLFDANPRKAGAEVLGHVVRPAAELEAGGLAGAPLLLCVNPRLNASLRARLAGAGAALHAVEVAP